MIKIVVTKLDKFTAKGTDYVNVHFVSEDGSVGNYFGNASDYSKFQLDDGSLLDTDIATLVQKSAIYGVEYNSRGKVIKFESLE